LPKTIDNDLALTDTTIGFDTALGIATAAIDRLHSTAHSHHRIIIAEIMGHRAGWLALGAGIAGGADVILIPEIPYDVRNVAAAIRRRKQYGTNFSIVAVAEGRVADAGGGAIRHRRATQAGSEEQGGEAARET
jgi:6-phosphofructokinase